MPERQSTKAWSGGAAGEAAVGARLDVPAWESIPVTHDRSIPRSKANIKRLAVKLNRVRIVHNAG